MMILFERAWDILVQNRRIYFVLNAVYYGVILICMIYGIFDPALHDSILKAYNGAFMIGPLAINTPVGLEMVKAAGSAFLLNLMGFSYGEITFPSFIIPFLGIPIGIYRAAVLGIFFSPTDPTIARVFLPHLPTLLLEGQAAILAMLGVYIHGMALFRPQTVGQTSRWKAYIEGVRQSGTIYLPIMAVLLISAIYGIIETAILATP